MDWAILLLSVLWTGIIFLLGFCAGRRTSLAQRSEAPTGASDVPVRAQVAYDDDRCPEAVNSVKVPWVHFGASCLTHTTGSCVETPAEPETENEFDEECCITKYRGVRMTVDEAYLAVLEEAQWRVENGPGAAYTASEVDWCERQYYAGEEPDASPRTKKLE